MELIYRQSFDISDAHLDCFGRVKPSAVLYFAQEVSANHAALLGASWEDLSEKELFWAILRHRVQIERLPMAGERITLETWPMPTTRVAYPRAVVAYDEKGDLLFRTVAIWVLMHKRTRAMVLPTKSDVVVPGIVRGTELALPSSLPPATASNQTLRTVSSAELDRNGHMNNTRYFDWVYDLLPSTFHQHHTLHEMTVCYLSEAMQNQTISLHWELSEAHCLKVEAHRGQQDKAERVFATTLQF